MNAGGYFYFYWRGLGKMVSLSLANLLCCRVWGTRGTGEWDERGDGARGI